MDNDLDKRITALEEQLVISNQLLAWIYNHTKPIPHWGEVLKEV